jgi:hypothetical protein
VEDRPLATGLYESLLTQDLLARLADLRAITADVPEGQQASALGDHVGRRVTRALAALPRPTASPWSTPC